VLCKDIMVRRVVGVEPAARVDHAARKMVQANVGMVVVWDGMGRALGVITDRDIAIRVCAERRLADAVPVREIMSRDLVTCRPDDDVHQAEELMVRHQKSRVLVVDDRRRCLGVISLADLAFREDPDIFVQVVRKVMSRDVLHPRRVFA
jgi:CBS domain-containing protein